jgi:hypothetical protein
MRTIILFIINLLVGVWCGLHSANAAPLPGMPVADVHSKSAAEEVGRDNSGTEAMRIQCPTHTTRLPIPTILHRLPFITHLPIRRTPTTGGFFRRNGCGEWNC